MKIGVDLLSYGGIKGTSKSFYLNSHLNAYPAYYYGGYANQGKHNRGMVAQGVYGNTNSYMLEELAYEVYLCSRCAKCGQIQQCKCSYII